MPSQPRRVFASFVVGLICVAGWTTFWRYAAKNKFVPVTVYLATTNAPLQITSANGGIYVLAPDGSVWIWGRTHSKGVVETPRKLPFPKGWKQIRAGHNNSVGIRDDGTLWRWGRVPETETNEIGRTWYYSDEPIQISMDTNWVSVGMELNSWFGLGVKNNGTLWGWGDNRFNVFGEERDLKFKTATPVQITTESNWSAAIAGHQFALTLKRDGTAWAWGDGPAGKPAQVSSDTNWMALLNYSHAQNTEGEVWILNNWRSTTPDLPISQTSPSELLMTNAITGRFCYGGVGDALMLYQIKEDGTLWAKSHPSMNHPSQTNISYQVGTRKDWVQLWSAGGACFGLTSDNTLWHWGFDLSVLIPRKSPGWVASIENQVRKFAGLPVNAHYAKPPTVRKPRPLVIFQHEKRAQTNN